MKILSFISLLIFSIISTKSYGISASIRPTLNGHTDEDCSSRSQNGGLSNLSEITQGLEHKAGWFEDRENKMTEENIDVAESMVVVTSIHGESQAVQVCEGVYLSTAHGVLSDPNKANYKEPKDSFFGVAAYPLTDQNYGFASTNEQFISPRLESNSAWDDASTDYVFIKLDKPLNNHFIRPINFNTSELVSLSNRDILDVHLYRGRSLYSVDNDQRPNFASGPETDFSRIEELYDSPLKVEQECRLIPYKVGFAGHDCPTEQGTSGSPLVSNVDGSTYLVGINQRGKEEVLKTMTGIENSNDFITSESFCSDYEKVCGQPCASSDVLNNAESVSL